ncbi:MAG: glycoside hydrolase family 127 protein [Planctomycetota bacterium]|nr:glycoside hydrolase family 127 protein [Planctomycetota bacterium]
MNSALWVAVSAFCLGVLTAMPVSRAEEVRCVKELPTAGTNGFYTSNRDPLLPSPLIKLPIGSIAPRGWLRKQLELEAQGMTGGLAEISGWLKFDDSAWASPEGKGKNGWEELPYWLKGYGDLGYVLGDETIIKAARKWIDATLASQQPDGYFGPAANKTGLDGKPDLWPHMVMLNVLQSFHEFTNDERVIPFMLKYHKWLNEQPPEAFGRGYWPKVRFGDNIETAFWLYNRTGEKWLLDLAQKIHDNMARWDTDVINWHNVNLAQGFREPGVFYMQAKDEKFLQAAERNYQKAIGMYGQFAGGGIVADENARPGYVDPRGGFETCGWVEFMHSFEMLTKVSGNPVWADRCEDIAFNSLPASLTPDLKALHYLTCPNQVRLDKNNKAPGVQNGGTMFSYSPGAVYRCCQHNVSHGWPYYAEELWLATPDKGLCASLYAASEVNAKVGDGTAVKIAEETDYPFSETITLKLSAPKPVRFPLYLRIPAWCAKPTLKINDKDAALTAAPLSFAVIDREWRDGDAVTLALPMFLGVRTWAKNKNSVSVDYGPLSFSLKIGEKWQRYGGSDQWPEHEVFPTTPWNYGLVLDEKEPAKSFTLVRKPMPQGTQLFTPEAAPIELQAKARKIPGWVQDGTGLVGKLQASPIKSDEPVETVTLIPMGCARLRISSFPVIGTGPDAQEWGTSVRASASHCFGGDSVDALNDGNLPQNSNDHNIPRMTWWDHKGTTEWVQYDFPKPQQVAASDVYWFDDTGKGGCRVPQSWKLLYKAGDEWKPVETGDQYGVKPDTFNKVTFKAVQTTALRLEAKLQDGFSGGILEWRVSDK